MIHIANKLRESLLDTMKDVGLDLLKKSTEAIQNALNCTEVSLWTINRNDTHVDGKNRPDNEFLSTSLISRTLSPECSFIFDSKDDFTHDFSGECYFAKVLRCKESFIRTNKEGALADKFKSEKFIYDADINDVIALLITDKDCNLNEAGCNDAKKIAILELSYSKCSLSNEELDVIVPILHDFFSAAFKRFAIIQQCFLLDELIRLYDKHKNGIAEEFFKDVITVVKETYCPCQGASFFMWDSFEERYNLIYTTGLVEMTRDGLKKENIHYKRGEGLTGKIGKFGKLFISDELSKEMEVVHKSKTCEEVIGDDSITSTNHTKTAMFIPIAYPNNSKEVVGILRLVNKTNYCESKFVDYFNYKIDGKVMEMASKYLSIVCDFYIKRDEQQAFISKMTHELNTPVNAIYKSSDLLFKHIDDEEFNKRYLKVFLKDIRNLALMQKWQIANNLQLSKRRKELPFNQRYNLQDCMLFEIVDDCRNMVEPITKKYRVPFDNIHIDNNLRRLWIKVDKNAFINIFYNLLINAIKYYDPDDVFNISISGYIASKESNDKILRITVEDNGIGINRKDIKTVFELGYRGRNALEQDAHGYGIGLTITKQIVEDFGGEIYILRNRKPTIFIIDLPQNILLS